MDSEKFVYWLQGALELNPDMLEKGMSPAQVKTIQDHLSLVLTKVTPDRFDNQVVTGCTEFNIEMVQPLHKNPESIDWNPDFGMPKVYCSNFNENQRIC